MLFPERKREPRTPAGTASLERSLAQATLVALLLAPPAALASPSSALREYKAGNYDQALKEYEQLLEAKSDDPRLHFNAGAAAYRNRQFEEAAKQFDTGLGRADVKLQGLAYYNEGNTLYHLGEQQSGSAKKSRELGDVAQGVPKHV